MSKVLVQRTVVVGVLIAAGVVYNYVQALELGEHLEQARTVAVTTMVFFQFFQTWNSRSESMSVFRMSPLSNPLLFFAIVTSILAQLAVIYAPGLSWIFQTEPLTVAEWAKIIVMSLSVILVVEIDKWLRRRRGRD
jgi:Ca2+-transporting ATPase